MKITKIVSIEYENEEEKKRAVETFEMFASIYDVEVKDETKK